MQRKESIEKANQLVEDLYKFRDNFYVINELSANLNKEVELEKKLQVWFINLFSNLVIYIIFFCI